jgi:hypothetical protein
MPRVSYVSMGCADTRTINVGEFEWAGQTWDLRKSVLGVGLRLPHGGPRSVSGGLAIGPKYPGCAACGKKSFFECYRCRNLSCWNEGASHCYWCGLGPVPTPGFIGARSID